MTSVCSVANTKTLLGGLTPDEFLSRYWQKNPLLIRGAWPGFESPLSPEELAGLACEEGVSPRLVLEQGGAVPWEVRYGPFEERSFTELPESHWTLLVTDVEKHLPDLHTLIEPFRFIADWRIDDLMISYAAEHGSVGPHVDDYDVFLLQARGHRRWQISTQSIENDNFVEGLELRILKTFAPEQEWVLGPGDMLYLPPRVAHHGVALDDCMTYSIGFRAPSHRELLTSFLEHVISTIDPQARYSDPHRAPQGNPGEIEPAALEKATHIVRTALQQSDTELYRWFGRFVTEPKADLAELYPQPQPIDDARFIALLKSNTLTRNGAAGFAFIRLQDTIHFFADGEDYELSHSLTPAIELLCQQRYYEFSALKPWLDQPDFLSLMKNLYVQGLLLFNDD